MKWIAWSDIYYITHFKYVFCLADRILFIFIWYLQYCYNYLWSITFGTQLVAEWFYNDKFCKVHHYYDSKYTIKIYEEMYIRFHFHIEHVLRCFTPFCHVHKIIWICFVALNCFVILKPYLS